VSAPTISPFPPDYDPGDPGGDAGDDPAAVIEQLLDLAGQARTWQHALLRTSTRVEALTGVLAAAAGPAAAGPAPGTPRPPAAPRVTGDSAVRAVIAALAAQAETVTWLCVRPGGHGLLAVPPGGDDPVAGPLLARTGLVRVLVCAPGAGYSRALGSALAGAGRSTDAASLRVTRSGGALGVVTGDLVVAASADAVAVVPGPDGVLCADAVAGGAANTIVRALADSLWDGALPPASTDRIDEVGRDPVKREILSLLEAGAKDEVIARALGVSLRTCRRHIAEMLSAAGASSRFQAASRLARAGLLGPR
jgi:DNA-binding CsgD family transcriptional regulator